MFNVVKRLKQIVCHHAQNCALIINSRFFSSSVSPSNRDIMIGRILNLVPSPSTLRRENSIIVALFNLSITFLLLIMYGNTPLHLKIFGPSLLLQRHCPDISLYYLSWGKFLNKLHLSSIKGIYNLRTHYLG